MQFFINIIDLSKMDDMNFTYEPGGHFVYRAPIAGVAFKISQRLCGLEASDLAASLERYLPREHDVPDTGNRSTLRFRFYTNTMDTLDESKRSLSQRSIL